MEKKLHETNSVEYFVVQIDKKLTWKQQIYHVTIKMNKVNAICYLN